MSESKPMNRREKKAANARLIAAAPDTAAERNRLLDILVPFVNGFVFLPDMDDLDNEQPIIIKAELGDFRKARTALANSKAHEEPKP